MTSPRYNRMASDIKGVFSAAVTFIEQIFHIAMASDIKRVFSAAVTFIGRTFHIAAGLIFIYFAYSLYKNQQKTDAIVTTLLSILSFATPYILESFRDNRILTDAKSNLEMGKSLLLTSNKNAKLYLNKALQIYSGINNVSGMAQAYSNYGEYCLLFADYHTAHLYYRKALECCSTCENKGECGDAGGVDEKNVYTEEVRLCLCQRGHTYAGLIDVDVELGPNKDDEITEKLHNGISDYYAVLACNHKKDKLLEVLIENKPDAFRQILERSVHSPFLKDAVSTQVMAGIARIITGYANYLTHMGDHGKARKILQLADTLMENYSEENGNALLNRVWGKMKHCLANAIVEEGKRQYSDEARKLYGEAERLFHQNNDHYNLAFTKISKGDHEYCRQISGGDDASSFSAIRHYKEAYHLSIISKNDQSLTKSSRRLWERCRDTEIPGEDGRLLDEAFDLSLKTLDKFEGALIAMNFGDMAKAEGDRQWRLNADKAEKFYQQSLHWYDRAESFLNKNYHYEDCMRLYFRLFDVLAAYAYLVMDDIGIVNEGDRLFRTDKARNLIKRASEYRLNLDKLVGDEDGNRKIKNSDAYASIKQKAAVIADLKKLVEFWAGIPALEPYRYG